MPNQRDDRPSIGIIGYGAFGQLMAGHLRRYFPLRCHDPLRKIGDRFDGGDFVSLAEAAHCSIVVLATPVGALAETVAAIAPHVKPGALVLDVGSVKMLPADVMRRGLPDDVDIVGTHPLFGPQSARHGISGLKIAICPVRGGRARRVAAFLRKAFSLKVFVTTPETHDREAAMVQGLTHLIAKVLVQMEPLPTMLTTKSFDLIVESVNMVRHDAPGVFQAIERLNPYAPGVRERFFALAAELASTLDEPCSAVSESPAPLSAQRFTRDSCRRAR